MEKIKTIRETSESVVKQMLNFCSFTIGDKILEPSAGKGVLLDHIKNIIRQDEQDFQDREVQHYNKYL